MANARSNLTGLGANFVPKSPNWNTSGQPWSRSGEAWLQLAHIGHPVANNFGRTLAHLGICLAKPAICPDAEEANHDKWLVQKGRQQGLPLVPRLDEPLLDGPLDTP